MLRQYLYISTAPSLSRDDVSQILQTSMRNNASQGVTGLLLYNGRNFLQLIEGEGVALDQLMKRISQDPRHSGVSMLHKSDVDVRSCPEWSMKRIAIAESIASRREELEKALPGTLDRAVRTMILNFAVLN